jgi:hypothetical protein
MDYPNETNHFLLEHALLLKNSYHQLLDKDLIPVTNSNKSFAEQLFNAPFIVVSHNNDSDPVFNYANLKALALFELSWEDLIQLPSRCSVEPVNQAERERLLAIVTNQGYIDHYQGIRISSTGKRFMIKNAVVWNLIDAKGNYKGQAAQFADWAFI